MRKDYIKRNQRGITFTEVMVSLLLLSISVGAVIGAFVICRASAIRAKHKIAAMNLARSKVETMKSMVYSQLPAQAGAESVTIDQGLSGQCTTEISDIYSNAKIYKITVTVAWTEFAHSLTQQVVTLISQH